MVVLIGKFKEMEERDLNLNKTFYRYHNTSQLDGVSLGSLDNLEEEISTFSLALDDVYSMNYRGKGHCIIFNQKRFDPHLCLRPRTGTDIDRDNVYMLFKSFGYEVIVHNDLTEKEIRKTLAKYAYRFDHSNFACFIVVLLSHGKSGLLFGRNKPFRCEDMFADFTAENCPSLAGKPKMFFIQACRGDQYDSTHKIWSYESRDQTDCGYTNYEYKITNQADFLVCWSTVPGYYSWRDKVNGSWFIQSLVHVFQKYAEDTDVLTMMTIVNRYMILNFESSNPNKDKKKQCAYTVSTLMRDIYLEPPL